MAAMLTRTTKRSGFTLIELMIFMIVMGTVLAGIWVISQVVWGNYATSKTQEEIVTIAQTVRDRFTGTRRLPGAANVDITANLDALSAFPPEMRSPQTAALGAATIGHALAAGQASLCVYSITGAGVSFSAASQVMPADPVCNQIGCFRIWANNIKSDSCIKLLTAMVPGDVMTGLVRIGANNGGAICNGANCIAPSAAFPRLTASVAMTWCDDPNGNNTIFWDFKL